jgi:hypothetical protein
VRRQREIVPSSELMALTERAIAAFGEDLDYAVAMVKVARNTLAKRTVWSLRVELRNAAMDAMRQCAETPAFTCGSDTPCGTGLYCRWSSGDLVYLKTPVVPGPHSRPQQSATPTFSVEPSVRELRELRRLKP